MTSPNSDKHAKVWNALFKDDEWLLFAYKKGLNPILIGCDLPLLFNTEDITKCPPTYLVLHCGYHRESLDLDQELFARSLKPWVWHDYSVYNGNDWGPRENSEIAFLEHSITLNIQHPWSFPTTTVIARPLKLFSEQGNGLHSAYLYWKDDGFMLRAIDPESMTKASLRNIAHSSMLTSFHMDLPEARKTTLGMNFVFLNLVPIGGSRSEMVSWYGMPLSWGFPLC